jgi:hypothetical protein
LDNQTASRFVRRYNNFTGTLSSNYIHLQNPWVVAWWSAAFPGFGHLKMGVYIKGYILIFWEIIINVHSRINEAMVYSFNGRFELAKETLNTKMLLLYIGIYIITIWDSYRQAVDLNKHYLLAEFEDAPIVPFQMNGFSLNFLDKRNPRFSLMFSLLFPGLGHLYLHRIPTGFFIFSWTIIIIYMSNLLDGLRYTLIGSFSEAAALLDPEWTLFLPSIYCFAAYEAYVICVEYNKLYNKEQRQFLQKNCQPANYSLL